MRKSASSLDSCNGGAYFSMVKAISNHNCDMTSCNGGFLWRKANLPEVLCFLTFLGATLFLWKLASNHLSDVLG